MCRVASCLCCRHELRPSLCCPVPHGPRVRAQHGETKESLCPGRTVEARVVYVGREEVKVRDGCVRAPVMQLEPRAVSLVSGVGWGCLPAGLLGW